MGYTTDFEGHFNLDKQLSLDDYRLLGHITGDCDSGKLKGSPGGYCQWVPTEDGRGVIWDGNEKFYKYQEWLQWIIDTILQPKGYLISGSVSYQGEEVGDCGVLYIEGKTVSKQEYSPKNSDIEDLVRRGLRDDESEALFYLKEIAKKLDIKID